MVPSRQNECATDATASPIASEELGIVAEASFPHIVKAYFLLGLRMNSSKIGIKYVLTLDVYSRGEMISKVMDLKFEARAKDGGWYDVAMFLSHRFLSSGKPEVLVSFQGFSSEEDEWVSVKAVRERSIPIDSSECWKVAVGDLVLCFRETSDGASHFDARVVEIQKKLHDMRGCRCIFLIRYDHDQTEERVHLRQLCRRPPN